MENLSQDMQEHINNLNIAKGPKVFSDMKKLYTDYFMSISIQYIGCRIY